MQIYVSTNNSLNILPGNSDLCSGSVGNIELTALRTMSSGLLTNNFGGGAAAAVVVDVVRLSMMGEGTAPPFPLDFRCFLFLLLLPDICCSLCIRTRQK